MVKLTVKQQRFADEYIRLGNITEAALNAGYSVKSARTSGQENMQNPAIKSYIDERLNELKKDSIAEQDEILQLLTGVLRGEETGTGLVGIGGGAQSVEKLEPTLMERIKAAELLGKRYALFTDRQQVENITPVFIKDVPEHDE